MSHINIKTRNRTCTIVPCATHVKRDGFVVFKLDDTSGDLDDVRVAVPGNVLRRNGKDVTQFTLTPADPSAEFTVSGTAGKGVQPINAVARFATGRTVNGTCEPAGEQVEEAPEAFAAGGTTGSAAPAPDVGLEGAAATETETITTAGAARTTGGGSPCMIVE